MWTEIKQRFLKFEAAHGLVLLILCVLVLLVAIFSLEHIFQAFAIAFGIGVGMESVRKIFYNPVKKAATLKTARDAYIAANIPPTPTPAATSSPTIVSSGNANVAQ